MDGLDRKIKYAADEGQMEGENEEKWENFGEVRGTLEASKGKENFG